MSRLWLSVVVAASTIPVALLVNNIIPNPYMDEIFHVPQMQQYCKGNFRSWDPKITTPPGLYLISYLYTSVLVPGMQAIGRVPVLPDLCCPSILRSLNIIFAIACAILFRDISLHIESNISAKVASLKALGLAWYPLHWFFTFLFYTDVGSTTAVMAMYLACLKEAYWTSGMLGLVAILFRQTNVVWTFFVACVGIIDVLERQKCGTAASLRGQHYTEPFQRAPDLNQRQPIVGSKLAVVSTKDLDTNGKRKPSICDDGLVEEILFVLCQSWQKRSDLIWKFFPLILPLLGFLLFVLYNGSIVLGAKEAHKASPHFAQVLYFGAVSAFAMAPLHLNPCLMRENFLRSVTAITTGAISLFAAGLIGALICIHFFSFAHPYLLSDNRHYTFYIWRRVVNAHWSAKYLFTLVYIYSWSSILTAIGRKERKLWLLIFCLAVVVVLVPAPLIEFRYYTVPFYFIALHTPTQRNKGSYVWVLISLQYFMANLLTMYMFLFRPFYISDAVESEAQRFIW